MIALIHNNNEQRNTYLKPKLTELSEGLSEYFDVTQVEISYQSQLIPHGAIVSLYREFNYHQLMNDFYKFHSIEGRNKFKAAIGFLRHTIKRYFLGRGNDLVMWQRKSAIETLLTEKHIAAWRRFLDSECNVLLCFEDDVMIGDGGIVDVVKLLLDRSLVIEPKAEFIDLAGGCNIDKLGINPTQNIPNLKLSLYTPGLSNTACSYLMTRNMARLFYAELEKNIMLRLIGADWLINKLFMRLSSANINYYCFHSKPTYFLHGTVNGTYPTSII